MNFFFLDSDNPLWFLSLFFKSAKCPSIALVVLGIFKSMLSYQVKSQGRCVLSSCKRFLAFYEHTCFCLLHPAFFHLKSCPIYYTRHFNPPSKLSLSVCFKSKVSSHNSLLACILGFFVKYLLIMAT